ncbi:hypothetical protein SBBP2_100014 [Burkholderiales bacterium]|nr:hypothetical protein SBBP2_100014 [Burkholderiales bacterium]
MPITSIDMIGKPQGRTRNHRLRAAVYAAELERVSVSGETGAPDEGQQRDMCNGALGVRHRLDEAGLWNRPSAVEGPRRGKVAVP